MRNRLLAVIHRGSGQLLAVCSLLLLAACGYVGDTLPPALYIPLPVADLSAQQEADELLVQFTMPVRSTEDLILETIPEVDLRVAVWENRDWDEGAWESEAQRLPVSHNMESATARTPIAPYIGRRLLMRVRVAGQKRRFSAWSEPVTLLIADPQPAPTTAVARSLAEGVHLEWQLPAPGLHSAGRTVEIWRQLEGEDEALLIGESEENSFLDRASPFGALHRYRLRTRVAGDDRIAFSRFTAEVELLPSDTYAPEAPENLLAIAATASVELSWQAGVAPDLAYYRVYRAQGAQDFVMIADKVLRSVYSDAEAPAGLRLRYRVTALDEAGNESPASDEVIVELPQ